MAAIGVLGTGTWGTALTRMLALNGHKVTCWSAIPEEIDQLSSTRRHPNLPGMLIPEEVSFSKDLGKACSGMDLVLFAVPSVYVRQTARKAAPFIPKGQVVADVAKGIEPETLLTMSEVINEELADARVAALSGPTHAEEVAKDLPTTIVSASRDQAVARIVQDIFSGPVMRVYTNEDILGVELSGALKNIIALASGISSGLGYGDNTKAALITRGLAEIKRLGIRMGCRPETFSGLAGMGDLIVTATSKHSRNNRCGCLIGQGQEPSEAVRQVGMVVEGINALPAAIALSKRYEVELPIIEAVNQVIHHGKSPKEAVRELMGRTLKTELELLEPLA